MNGKIIRSVTDMDDILHEQSSKSKTKVFKNKEWKPIWKQTFTKTELTTLLSLSLIYCLSLSIKLTLIVLS